MYEFIILSGLIVTWWFSFTLLSQLYDDKSIDLRSNNLRFVKQIISKEKNSDNHISQLPSEIVCRSGEVGILNDDYCDCESGEDEPMTSACSFYNVHNRTFLCNGFDPDIDYIYIFSSRVNDGVQDCFNGSDEKARLLR